MKEIGKHRLYFDRAVQRARLANEYIAIARKAKADLEKHRFLISGYSALMIGSGLLVTTVLFFIAAPVEILVSYEMYREMLVNFSPSPAPWMVWLMGFFVVGFAAVVSLFIGETVTPNLFDWAVFNKMYLQSNTEMLEVEAREQVGKVTRKKFVIGLVLFLLLIALVTTISFQRSFLTMKAMGAQSDYSTFEKWLPVVIVVIEVFCGVYLEYNIRYVRLTFNALFLQKKYQKWKKKGAAESQMAYALWNTSRRGGKEYEIGKDLNDAIYRSTFISTSEDRFVEETILQQCKVIVKRGGKYVPGVRIVGLLKNGRMTNAAYTNRQGIAFLNWEEQDLLNAVSIQGTIFEGPFYNGSFNEFNVDVPLMTQTQ